MTPGHCIRQHGPVTRVRFNPINTSGIHYSGWKFKVFRKNGSNIDQVGESESFTTTAFGDQTRDLSSPITGCQPGDLIAVYIPSGAILSTEYPAASGCYIGYTTGDVTTRSATPSSDTWFPRLVAYGPPPFLAIMGDSETCAHGQTAYHPFRDATPNTGDTAGEPASVLRGIFPSLTFQNFSRGSTKWSDGASIISDVNATYSKTVLCHFGVNDVFGGDNWTTISGNMGTVKSGLTHGQVMFVDEILADTANTAIGAAIRSTNASYASWCTSNGGVLVPCHDAMGQIRQATGYLDDLSTAYNYDGVHLTVPAGINAFVALQRAVLDAYAWT